jgi:hypothetical protein
MRYLVLTSIITAIVSMAIVALVNFLVKGRLSAGDIVTAVTIGVGGGLSIFLVYRNRSTKNCR